VSVTGKTTRADGDRTRERILEVALPLFARHGFAGTSVRTIASAAGVNVATLAYHFTDKEGLYDTVVQRVHLDMSGEILEPPPGGPREILRFWIQSGYRFAQSHREHIQLLLRHVLDHGSLPQVVLDRWSEPLLSRAETIVALFRPDLPRQRHRLLVMSLQHLTVRLVLEDPRQLSQMSGIPEDRLEDELIDWLTTLAAHELGM
jgi:AcrR family transcriptional regulator